MVKSERAMNPLFEWMNNHPGVNLTVGGFESSIPLFDNLGYPLDDMVIDLNTYVTLAQQQNNSDIIRTGQLLNQMSMFQYILMVSSFVYYAIQH